MLRFLAKAPAALFDLRLGWLLGHRFMLLTHRGRRSGRVYRTCIEVLQYEHASGACLVLSGWGTDSDWFGNVAASPALKVQVGSRSFVPAHSLVTGAEAAAAFERFRRSHPVEWRLGNWLPRLMRSVSLAELPLVRFHPRSG